MNNFITEGLPILLIPTTGVSLVLVSLVLLFARENAQAVLRQMFLYGVVITAFIVSAVSVVGLLYTALTTTVFPVTVSQVDRSLTYATLPSELGLSYAPGVESYLNQERTRFQKLANEADTQAVWRDQLAWTIPMLVVFLPILLSYRRFLTQK